MRYVSVTMYTNVFPLYPSGHSYQTVKYFSVFYQYIPFQGVKKTMCLFLCFIIEPHAQSHHFAFPI